MDILPPSVQQLEVLRLRNLRANVVAPQVTANRLAALSLAGQVWCSQAYAKRHDRVGDEIARLTEATTERLTKSPAFQSALCFIAAPPTELLVIPQQPDISSQVS